MTHGHASNYKGKKATKTYRTWTSVIQRCRNPNHMHFELYKDKLSERWELFEHFLEDMGERPEGTSLDRIDGTKGYYKENCRWADSKVQGRNRVTVKLSEEDATEIRRLRSDGMQLKAIATLLGVSISTIKNVIYRGDWS